jgi:hypothetical protein
MRPVSQAAHSPYLAVAGGRWRSLAVAGLTPEAIGRTEPSLAVPSRARLSLLPGRAFVSSHSSAG